MAPILKVKAKWTGFSGAPGYSNFYFRDFSAGPPVVADAQAAAGKVNTFFSSVKALFPSAVKIDVQTDCEVIEETTGALVDILNISALTQQVGTAAAASYSAASGAVVTWRTSSVHRGRRVRGRTFLVPTANVAYDLDGTLQASTITTLTNAANALRDASTTPDLGIWARPSTTGASDGAWYAVTSATIPDMVAVLRSRRD